MPTADLTHHDLLRWRDCPRRFWLHRQQGQTEVACHTQAEAGSDDILIQNTWPDQALRATFPLARVIDAPTTPAAWDEAIAHTLHHLATDALPGAATDGRALFGACLRSNDGAQVRIDVITGGQHGLRLFKVRHATVGDEHDLDAVALWAHVAARCGLRLQSVGLLLVDTDFVYPGHSCYAGLFREVDLSPTLGSRPVPSWLVAMRACEKMSEPAAPVDAPCTRRADCAFMAHCGVQANDARAMRPASLEVVGRELAASLRDEGHTDLHTVSASRMPDARRLRALLAVQSGEPRVDPAMSELIKTLPYPRATLRFDTIGFATPIWAGTRPYQVLPFQWTCDVQGSQDADAPVQGHSFLAGQEGDPRRAFAESLLQAAGGCRTVFAYNAGFERNRIRELANLYEDLATDLETLLNCIVDLFQIARAHYYHPQMCGSWSFKSVCRAVAPDLQVDQFEWEGITAPQLAFATSQQGQLDARRLSVLQTALKAHGQRETQALRRMVALFEGAAGAPALKPPWRSP